MFIYSLLMFSGVSIAFTDQIEFKAGFDITNIVPDSSTSSWEVAGQVYDNTIAGFSGWDVTTGLLVACESSYGDIDVYRITNIISQSALILSARVIYDQTGTPRVGGPVMGQQALCNITSTNTVLLPPSKAGCNVSDYLYYGMLNESLKRVGRFIDTNTISLGWASNTAIYASNWITAWQPSLIVVTSYWSWVTSTVVWSSNTAIYASNWIATWQPSLSIITQNWFWTTNTIVWNSNMLVAVSNDWYESLARRISATDTNRWYLDSRDSTNWIGVTGVLTYATANWASNAALWSSNRASYASNLVVTYESLTSSWTWATGQVVNINTRTSAYELTVLQATEWTNYFSVTGITLSATAAWASNAALWSSNRTSYASNLVVTYEAFTNSWTWATGQVLNINARTDEYENVVAWTNSSGFTNQVQLALTNGFLLPISTNGIVTNLYITYSADTDVDITGYTNKTLYLTIGTNGFGGADPLALYTNGTRPMAADLQMGRNDILNCLSVQGSNSLNLFGGVTGEPPKIVMSGLTHIGSLLDKGLYYFQWGEGVGQTLKLRQNLNLSGASVSNGTLGPDITYLGNTILTNETWPPVSNLYLQAAWTNSSGFTNQVQLALTNGFLLPVSTNGIVTNLYITYSADTDVDITGYTNKTLYLTIGTNNFGGGAGGSGDFKADGSVAMTGNLNFGGQLGTNLATPTATHHATTKAYVDGTTNSVLPLATNQAVTRATQDVAGVGYLLPSSTNGMVTNNQPSVSFGSLTITNVTFGGETRTNWPSYQGRTTDSAAFDYVKTDFITDGTTRDLDMSSKIPTNAKSVVLRLQLMDGAIASCMRFLPNGNTNLFNASGNRTQVANLITDVITIVPLDAGRVIHYNGDNVTFDAINVYILGWFF